MSNYTIPGLSEGDGKQLVDLLQERLTAYNDLHLILKHAHWNVVGRSFMGVHEMIDPQVDLVRGFADDVAERIAALGGSAIGTPASHVEGREPLEYPVNRGTTTQHLTALNKVYDQVVADVRAAIEAAGKVDPVTEDLLTGQSFELEKFQWFVRAHLEDGQGNIDSENA
ncbi:DNA starvation/stationary phase protection protein Dps [Corynebacterium bovis]|uniref:Starvation-inducible DNA-binding protein n=1 Tax=Corynebacterium bovis DSM 20582 = CIP 54.80 TaxID=927655 RepID=A0A8H9YB38_9CORY|nr:DNA starvation/stationary phase protection protein Dps [Corynebacterium bovis]MBB3116062.1 starvation-inducible DNA-binding protein [Corynebacterium bovis DSM 20582 = CIP 54.80]QQC47000.1 DNA starvation/stationary phase protection protein Dps [Corynebacterium bovis]WJY76648.1 DNA protection during starvation protein [Corynebacterium bovis DSM 20582 = CIP 54.80]